MASSTIHYLFAILLLSAIIALSQVEAWRWPITKPKAESKPKSMIEKLDEIGVSEKSFRNDCMKRPQAFLACKCLENELWGCLYDKLSEECKLRDFGDVCYHKLQEKKRKQGCMRECYGNMKFKGDCVAHCETKTK